MIKNLAHELRHEILSPLDWRTLGAMSSTFKAWLTLCHDTLLWQHLYALEDWLIRPQGMRDNCSRNALLLIGVLQNDFSRELTR